MKRAALILISLPAILAAVEAVSFYVRNRSNGSIVSSGVRREYVLYVPRSYDPSKPTPLVISMHGAGGWPVLQRELSEWNRLADREGFIVVYPSAAVGGGPRVWNLRSGRDVRFISDLIDHLRATYNIDPQRIYANGLSNGAGMSFALSCALSDRIAAVGLVAAAHTLPSSWCTDTRAVPMIAFHGTADTMTPYRGGTTWTYARAWPDIPTFIAQWARRNRCAPEPVDSLVANDVTRREYTNCADDASVVFYTLRGGGHTWPGGKPLPEWFVGPTSRSVDATGEMWAFFRGRRLTNRGGAENVGNRSAGNR